jgi:hypothetical protein
VDFVNSFSFIFLEFLAKFYRVIVFSWAESAKLKGYTENQTEPAREPRQAGWPGSTSPRGPSGGSPQVYPETCLFDFLLWSEHFKGSMKKENAVSRVFVFGLFNWPRWELRNPSHLAFSCTHAATMMSPKSVEL